MSGISGGVAVKSVPISDAEFEGKGGRLGEIWLDRLPLILDF